MSNREVREPQQQRSIEKRNKIIEAGFHLFCEKGYHNTNTVEIAKLAGVSTGIVYNYFEDKKDIFIAAYESYANKIFQPIYEKLSSLEIPIDLPNIIRQIIEMCNKSHSIARSAHEEIEAMSHLDEDVREFYCKFQANLATSILNLMKRYSITPTHAYEKVYIAIDIVENLCHETVYHQHEYINYDIMTDVAIRVIVDMFTN